MISGRFPREPSVPERGIPHVGFIPTGAVMEFEDKFVRSVGSARRS